MISVTANITANITAAITFTNITIPSSCLDATVENSDLSYSNTVASGGTLVLPNITFTDSDGTPSSVPSVKNITATPCAVQSGIIYNEPSLTGATYLDSAGSDYWRCVNGFMDINNPSYPINVARLDPNALDPFNTLIDNNFFGNKNVWTDENGLQVYGNNYAINHHLNRGVVIGIRSAKAWSVALSEYATFSLLGYSDFFVPNLKEMDGLINLGLNNTLGYSPLNFPFVGGQNIWTSTTNLGDVNYVYIIQPFISATFGHNVARQLKGGSFQYYLVRRHFN